MQARSSLAPQQTAFTLIEVLLAMALTGLVLALVGPLTLQTAETRKVAQALIARQEWEAVLYQTIADDFSRLLSVEWKENVPLTVVEGSMLVLEIPALAAVPGQRESLHTALHPCLVRYWRKQKGHNLFDLEREQIDLTQLSRMSARETIAKNLAAFDMLVRRKKEWSAATAIAAGALTNIEVIRMETASSDARKFSRTFVVSYAQ